jgi:uncharacterized membrane protein
MNWNKLFDLRFVIGSFFSIVAIILLIYSFSTETENARDVNRWCGLFFLVFGIIMIILSLRKDASDELPIED